MDKYESASLRFLVKPRNDSTVDETCNHILETFLSEARSRYYLYMVSTSSMQQCLSHALGTSLTRSWIPHIKPFLLFYLILNIQSAYAFQEVGVLIF